MTNQASNRSGPGRHWLAVFLYAGMIFLLSDQGFAGRKPDFYYKYEVDKMIHFVEFFFFAVLLCRAVCRTVQISVRGIVLAAVLIAFGYAISDEIHQGFVPDRSRDILDVLSDLVGATAGGLVWARAARKRAKRDEAEEEECSAT